MKQRSHPPYLVEKQIGSYPALRILRRVPAKVLQISQQEAPDGIRPGWKAEVKENQKTHKAFGLKRSEIQEL